MADNAARFWWESVTGPATVVTELVSQLGQAQCVALRLPDHMPWLGEFRDAVTEGLRRQQPTRQLAIERVWGDVDSHPENILLEYALEEERLTWRPYSESLSSFLQRTKALQGHLVWVRELDGDTAQRWADVCSGFSPQGCNEGLVLLECPDVHIPGMTEVRYQALVSEYSCRLFCAHLADSAMLPSTSDARKEYTAALLSRLCAGDPELAVRVLKHYTPVRDEPLEAFSRVENVPEDTMRQAGIHVWEAQLECLFPLVEAERLQIVDAHAEQLDELCRQGLTNAFGERVESREDLEVGTLCWLTGYSCPPEMRLVDCDSDEREHIRMLRDCRNSLAHRHVVEEAIVRRLVD